MKHATSREGLSFCVKESLVTAGLPPAGWFPRGGKSPLCETCNGFPRTLLQTDTTHTTRRVKHRHLCETCNAFRFSPQLLSALLPVFESLEDTELGDALKRGLERGLEDL